MARVHRRRALARPLAPMNPGVTGAPAAFSHRMMHRARSCGGLARIAATLFSTPTWDRGLACPSTPPTSNTTFRMSTMLSAFSR